MNGLSCYHSQQVGPKTVPDNLHCLCTHLSAFGGDFFVAPNPIDFDKVWAEFGNLAESGNFVVLATVCSIFGLYFVGLVFARKADRKDEMKVRLVLFSLCTNAGEKMDLHKFVLSKYLYIAKMQKVRSISGANRVMAHLPYLYTPRIKWYANVALIIFAPDLLLSFCILTTYLPCANLCKSVFFVQ